MECTQYFTDGIIWTTGTLEKRGDRDNTSISMDI
jgi:hypothetical protein